MLFGSIDSIKESTEALGICYRVPSVPLLWAFAIDTTSIYSEINAGDPMTNSVSPGSILEYLRHDIRFG